MELAWVQRKIDDERFLCQINSNFELWFVRCLITHYCSQLVERSCCRTSGSAFQRACMCTAVQSCNARRLGRSYLGHQCSRGCVLRGGTKERQLPLAISGHRETSVWPSMSLWNRRPRTRHVHVPHYTVQWCWIWTTCNIRLCWNQLTHADCLVCLQPPTAGVMTVISQFCSGLCYRQTCQISLDYCTINCITRCDDSLGYM